MAIKKYTNFDGINTNSTNEGQFLQADDLFIVSKNEIEEADFGECRYDVMEVSIYDVNNLLLPTTYPFDPLNQVILISLFFSYINIFL